jgi:DNA-binding NtrC family response regulator
MIMLLGKSPALLEVTNAAGLIAATDVTALIHGESGSGKESLARSIHAGSRRSRQPFIAVNCSALSSTSAESQLFGHVEGAFVSAVSDHDGYVQQAGGGTLFLDEVAELPAAVQAKLLNLLESGEVLPLGAADPVKMDVRIVAATSKDLQQEVAAGKLREDLFYRLNVVPLNMPPLRERLGDLSALLTHFSRESADRYGLKEVRFSKASLSQLRKYDWPGNVQELSNLCERVVLLLPGKEITPHNLPQEFQQRATTSAIVELPATGLVLADLEKNLIQQALERTAGNRSRAARLLGISRDTLLYRLRKFSLV